MIRYDTEFALEDRQTGCWFNLAHKLKRTSMFETKMN